MQHTIPLPHNAGSVVIDFAALPEVTRNWVIAYGIRQGIVDAASGAAKYATDTGVSLSDAVTALCGKRIEAMKSGTVGIRAQANPLRAELVRILVGAHAKFRKLDRADLNELADAIITGGGNEVARGFLAEAKRRIAKATPVAELDLGI